MAGKDYPIKDALCPWCGYHADSAGDMQGVSPERPPEPGDRLICLACGRFMVFDNDMRVVKFDYDMWKELSPEEKQRMVSLKITWLTCPIPPEERRRMRERGGRT